VWLKKWRCCCDVRCVQDDVDDEADLDEDEMDVLESGELGGTYRLTDESIDIESPEHLEAVLDDLERQTAAAARRGGSRRTVTPTSARVASTSKRSATAAAKAKPVKATTTTPKTRAKSAQKSKKE
jgi:hypothetical protein